MITQAERDRCVEEWELRRLTWLYARAMDSNEPEILERIFTDDAVIESPLRAQRGIAEVRAIPGMLKQMFASTMHTVHNQTVSISGDTADGETYCVAYQLKKPKDGVHRRLDWGIRYQDKFVRKNGAWRFSHRRLIVEWEQITEVKMVGG